MVASMKNIFCFILITLINTQSFAASPEPVRGKSGMVASTDVIASQVGVEILKKGGNAIDAAVAVGFALAVTWPSAGNLGGGGFMLVHSEGKEQIYDYREMAPLSAHKNMYLDKKGNVIKDASLVGYKASGIPGTVAGMFLAHNTHGKLKWFDVVEPARALAEEGFAVSYILAKNLKGKKELLEKNPETKKIFLNRGKFYNPGDILIQRDLADVLKRIQNDPTDFYRGKTAELIHSDMKKNGGTITLADLAAYKPVIRGPLYGKYKGYDIVTMPPPSSGGIALIEMLNILENFELSEHNASQSLHPMIEAMKYAFADRAEHLGDPDFVRVPVKELTDKKYGKKIFALIDKDKSTPSADIKAFKIKPPESKETTHFTVIDKDGNAVSNTYTLNGSYGSGVTIKGTGILFNNEMDDFTAKVGSPNMYGLLQSAKNSIAALKRPLSAMTPTIVKKNGKVILALGSPGGPTIINSVLQTILNVVTFKMNIKAAVDAPRFHHQWMPDEIAHEPFGLNADTRSALEKMGHKFSKKAGHMGDVEAIFVEPDGTLLGASDSRLGGVPVGY